MGAFNTLRGAARCPACGCAGEFEVQFKYGDTWQHAYRPGDRLRWGGNDVGSPGHRRVRVEAVGGPCTFCGRDALDFDVLLDRDEIVGIEAVPHRSSSSPEGFLVLEP